MSYLDGLPKDLLDLICRRCQVAQIDAIFKSSDKLINQYDTNNNNELWVRRMTGFSTKVISVRDQVLKQEHEDQISMREYRKVLHQVILDRKLDYIPENKIDLVENGFLMRYPNLADQLFNQILVNFNYHRTDSRFKNGYGMLMDSQYSTIRLAIIFNRVDMIEEMFHFFLELKLWDQMGIHGRNHIKTIFENHQFHLLPYFDIYQEKWIEDLFDNENEGCIGYHWIVDKEITPSNLDLLIEYLKKSIRIIIEKYSDNDVGRFITQFYHEYCSMDNACSCDKSFEPLITFLCQLRNHYKDFLIEFYNQDFLMNFDSLVHELVKENRDDVCHVIIENIKCYSDREIVERLKFCLDRPELLDINLMLCRAIHFNNAAALQYLIDRFSIHRIKLVRKFDNYSISFDVLQVIVSTKVDIVNPNRISSFILENFEQIERYLDLFRIIKTNDVYRHKYPLIKSRHLESFIQQWTIFLVDNETLIHRYHQILNELFVPER